MKALLLLATLGSFCTTSLNAVTGIDLARPAPLSATHQEHPSMIIAGKLDWLDDLIRGTRGTDRVGRQAYQADSIVLHLG